MKITGEVDQKELNKLLEKFKLAPEKIKSKYLYKSVKKGADIVKQSAKQKAPFDTGTVRKAISVKKANKKEERLINSYSINIGTSYFIAYVVYFRKTGYRYYEKGVGWTIRKGEPYYGKFIEYGTKRIDPKPFMLPALIENQDTVKNVIRSSLVDFINDFNTLSQI